MSELDTTHFINFLEKTKVRENKLLVSMDITSLYTNIPQEERIYIVCNAYKALHRNEPPIPTWLLQRALKLILVANSFQFNGENYKQIPVHETAISTKMAVAFANIFMAKVGTEILTQSALNRSSGNDSLTTSSPSGTQPEKTSHSSLNKLANTIKLWSLRLRYRKKKQTSWTLLLTN